MNEAILSVLVVERHPMMREALCTAIAGEAGLAVAGEAAGGAEALQMADRLQPGVILYALDSPSTDDLKALRLLRAHLPGASILALSGQEVPDQAVRECGVHAVLTKAASRNEIIQALRRMGTRMSSPVSG